MTENNVQDRAAACGAGVLLAIIFLFAHLPLVLLIVPVMILFLGIAADPEEMQAAWYGMLNTAGSFDPAILNEEETAAIARERHYFWFGEVASAAALASVFTVPLGMYLTEKAGYLLSFIIAAMIFLVLFIFLPKIIHKGMMSDTDTILEMFGKNEQFRKVFWTVFITFAGFVLAQIVDPEMARGIIEALLHG
ncbi:MAG: hypothetical protein WCB46_03570 [Methanoregula sp.]